MELSPKKHRHQFFTPWYAGDEESDDWISYLSRNLHHLSGENIPFHDSSWTFYEDEAELHDQVLNSLYQNPEVDASHITVYIIDKTVCLIGTVDSEKAKLKATEVVQSLPEVWKVQNDLVVEIT